MSADRNLKIGSFLIFVLAVLFYVFFMQAKHDPALSKVNAFADDPYDAVGSFGIQAAAFLAILGLVRAFRSSDRRESSADRERFLLRAQTAAVLSVAVTLAADAVAMLRHPSAWIGVPAGGELLGLLGGMAALTIAIGFWIRRSAARSDPRPGWGVWTRTWIVSLFVVLVLLLYPDHFRRGLMGVLFTAFSGTVVLFVSMWAWTIALVPDEPGLSHSERTASRRAARKKYAWGLVIVAGILIGLFFVAGEASEGAGIPHSKLALVISAYVGLETAGVMIGYSLLGKPLGLFRENTR